MKFLIFGQGLQCSVQQLQSPVGKSGQCEIVRCNESGEERNATKHLRPYGGAGKHRCAESQETSRNSESQETS